VPYKDETIPCSEKWYYELDGRAHGPMRWSDLEELVGRAGETASQVRVRQGANGDWKAFRSGAATAAPSASARQSERFEQRSLARPGRQWKWEGISPFFQQRWDLAPGVGVWMLLNVLFVLFWPAPYANERRYLATLKNVVNEADALRASSVDAKEWADLAKRTKERLVPMVAELKKSASSSELPRQQLLWCARDLAPKIMGAQTKECEENERRMKQYLQSVEQTIGGR
jgi:hypothetical protein